ncbi:MAG: cbb3-type cytochrome c oxidase subunit I [Hymenobacter sp.]
MLFQHLFWFLGHPEVYIVIMPAMGMVSEVLATNARKPIFGYRAMIGSLMGIALLVVRRVGSPYVHHRHEPIPRFGLHVPDPDYCRAIGRESV